MSFRCCGQNKPLRVVGFGWQTILDNVNIESCSTTRRRGRSCHHQMQLPLSCPPQPWSSLPCPLRVEEYPASHHEAVPLTTYAYCPIVAIISGGARRGTWTSKDALKSQGALWRRDVALVGAVRALFTCVTRSRHMPMCNLL